MIEAHTVVCEILGSVVSIAVERAQRGRNVMPDRAQGQQESTLQKDTTEYGHGRRELGEGSYSTEKQHSKAAQAHMLGRK